MTFRAQSWLLGALLSATLTPTVAMAAEDDAGSFYASLAGVHVSPSDSNLSFFGPDAEDETVDLSLKGSLGILAAVGYDTGSGLRAEMELGYRAVDMDNYTIDGGPSLSIGGDISTLSLMLNGYYVLDQWEKMKPYIGGGIGFARQEVTVRIEAEAEAGEGKDDDTVLGYQAMVGIGYSLSENTEVRLGYRYFATEDIGFDDDDDGTGLNLSYQTHNIEAGLLFRF